MSDLSCPSRAWDRYCAMHEGPYPVGEPFRTVSPKRHHCGSCFAPIEANVPHEAQDMHDDEGRFCGRQRYHLKGECAPEPSDCWESQP